MSTAPKRPVWQAFRMDGIGDRIAHYRRRKGLSQAALAGLVGRSESWLSQVERGKRGVDNLTVIRDLATALGISVDTLTGSPQTARDRAAAEDNRSSAIAGVRAYIDGYAWLVESPQKPTEPAAVAAALDQLNAHYQAARYGDALDDLPQLLDDADCLPPGHASLQVATWIVGAKVLHKVGANRLAGLAADRAARAARTGSPADRGLAARQVAESLLRAGEVDTADMLVTSMAETLDRHADPHDDELRSVRGALWLLAAVIAARRTERFEALSRLDKADTLARELGRDDNLLGTAFGPTNVLIHSVSVAAELQDAGEALRIAETIDPEDLPDGLVSRRAQLHLDLAWAYTQQRRDTDACLQLMVINQIAPQLIEHSPILREAIHELLGRARIASGGRLLTDLAKAAGIL